jgi:hypothetical protein
MKKLVNIINNYQELFFGDCVVQLDRGQVLAHKINGIGMLVLFLPEYPSYVVSEASVDI